MRIDLDVRQGKRRDAAWTESGRLLDLEWLGDAGGARLDRRGHLRRVAAAIARHEGDDGPLVADEHEGLHDLLEVAARGVGRCLRRRRALGELLDARLGSRLTEEGGHPLDGFRPGPDHGSSLPRRRQYTYGTSRYRVRSQYAA